MKKIALAFGAILAVAVPEAHAQAVIADTDGDGVFSMEELVAAFPDMTTEAFVAADSNGDGSINMEELAAALEAGHIPA